MKRRPKITSLRFLFYNNTAATKSNHGCLPRVQKTGD